MRKQAFFFYSCSVTRFLVFTSEQPVSHVLYWASTSWKSQVTVVCTACKSIFLDAHIILLLPISTHIKLILSHFVLSLAFRVQSFTFLTAYQTFLLCRVRQYTHLAFSYLSPRDLPLFRLTVQNNELTWGMCSYAAWSSYSSNYHRHWEQYLYIIFSEHNKCTISFHKLFKIIFIFIAIW